MTEPKPLVPNPEPTYEDDWRELWRILTAVMGIVVLILLCGGFFMPTLGGHREPARRTESMNNLRQISIAIQSKASSDPRYRMPPVAIVDEAGNPLLSWRVLLLPEFDRPDLLEKFDLTKPWDSPENLPLIEQMPGCLASPYDRAGAREGKTPYKAITPDSSEWSTAWGRPGQRMRMSQFKDGQSQTMMVVEDLTDPVVWTKPEDITPSQYLKTIDHGEWSSKSFLVAFADGSVKVFIDPTAEEIQPMLYADDGKVAEE